MEVRSAHKISIEFPIQCPEDILSMVKQLNYVWLTAEITA